MLHMIMRLHDTRVIKRVESLARLQRQRNTMYHGVEQIEW